MSDIDFASIAPRCGGQREAFEELCCQIASHVSPGAKFVRLRGAGGDGGVECFAERSDGTKVGWQAKYVFEIEALLKQLTASLTTVLKINESLVQYVVCFPFNLTGPTGRRGKSELDKFEEWRKAQEAAAKKEGRALSIERWSASHIQSELLGLDPAGGVREYFFDRTILSGDWFSQQIASATKAAGPRYTQGLSVETELWKWFEAVVRATGWSDALKKRVRDCQKHCDDLLDAVGRTDSNAHSMTPAWPEDFRADAKESITGLAVQLRACAELPETHRRNEPTRVLEDLRESIVNLREIEAHLAIDLDEKHGKGCADSPGFRQFMAEYECSFPAANLDDVRDAITAIEELVRWLGSPNGWLAFEPVFIMTGTAGSGKTHGVCDLANRRLEEGRLTCVCYGHEFGGEPEVWTRLREVLGLPATLGRDGVLDCLNAAAEASGEPLILIIDAVNETKPLRYWRERISAFCAAIKRRPNLRLCFTCRTSFAPHCLPDGSSIFVADHRGFEGIERDACQAFFEHYGLKPPITPILQPELANPLYLRLICETACSQGLTHLPSGWLALSTAVKSFLDEKENQFAVEHETNPGAAIVSGSLLAIARELARSGEPSIAWSKAEQVISTNKPVARALPVLAWLARSDLVIEDAPHPTSGIGTESTVRPSFERLGDFLIANELLSTVEPDEIHAAFHAGGALDSLFANTKVASQNNGVISALSILLSENVAPGTELTNYLDYGPIRNVVLPIVVDSFLSRDPSSFSFSSIQLAKELLASSNTAFNAMDAVVAISWRPSELDAFWLDGLLNEKPLAVRDAFWCAYLHDRYEHHGAVRRLIDAAFELPLDRLDAEIAERWALVLLWFTAAADRRVKDFASRGAIAVLHARAQIAPSVLRRMMEVDDDAVRERVLLAIYGGMLQTRNVAVLPDVCRWLCERLEAHPRDFDNALIRDHTRCLCEFADHLNVLPDECDVGAFSRPLESEWPLVLPCDEDVERWKELPRLEYSCLDDDFFTYAMSCLHGWEDAVARVDMGRWILRHIAEDMGYEDSGCERYDNYMLGKYGQGRAKPVWAERIGKKYQWIGMFRLAARLADHAERKRSTWVPELTSEPLVLCTERQLDPTLSTTIADDKREGAAWWIQAEIDLNKYTTVSDEDWVSQREDVPNLRQLVAPFEGSAQRRWRLLEAYPSWNNRPPDGPLFDAVYRNMWIHVCGYLVKSRDAKLAFDCLVGRNFFGRWMPEGGTSIHGFLGEYPWASTYEADSEEHYRPHDLPCEYIPASMQIASEWEYDASLPRSIYVHVPARGFFSQGDLWWNGKDGFGNPGGKTLFQDPSVTEAGPGALIADAEDLTDRLDKMGYHLIWTLLGEKLVVGGPRDTSSPRRAFSQVARLHRSGRLQTSELTFFDNYDESVGPVQL